MCVVSMVHDHFQPMIPIDWKPLTITTSPFVTQPSIAAEIAELRQLIADFRAAVAAAKKVDELTSQPDCVDPEKAKLEQRVAELERRLDAMRNI